MKEDQIFSLVGEEGLTRLVAVFYRQVYDGDILGPMYPKNQREAAEQRLRDFLIYRFGGPQRYIEQRGCNSWAKPSPLPLCQQKRNGI
jgi:hemoglobin